jgi:AraC family transcriptional activator of pobA
MMKHIKFNKTLCGVDFLLNVINVDASNHEPFSCDLQTADFFQIVFVHRGDGSLLLNDQSIDLRDNQVLFISQNQKYKWDTDPASLEATFLVFQEDFLNAFFSDQYFTYRLLYFYQTEFPLLLQIDMEAKLQFASQLQEIKSELVKPQSDSVHLIRSILYYLLAKLNRTYAGEYEISVSDMTENLAFQFRKLAETNIRSKQRVDDYADMMKVSRITLNKVVKKQFNQTTSEFLKSRLIHEIKMELIYSNKSIDQLSQDFSFSESNHFSRFFKMQMGITPSDYRINYQNGSL